jgi:carbonic anhydrase
MSDCTCCAPRHLRRRGLLASLATGLACTALAGPLRALVAAPPRTTLTPDQAIAALLEGNRRFLSGAVPPAAPDPARRATLAAGQAPFAAILGCADSRAAPELLFNAGLGELFVVRNAGNIADNGAIGSLEFAIGSLGVPLIVVLGHQRCGAASAAVAMAQNELALPRHLRDMLLPILPSALAAIRAGGDTTDGAVRGNIARNIARLTDDSPSIQAAVAGGRVRVVGAYYELAEERVVLTA